MAYLKALDKTSLDQAEEPSSADDQNDCGVHELCTLLPSNSGSHLRCYPTSRQRLLTAETDQFKLKWSVDNFVGVCVGIPS
uniref:Uncharacterized protein n=1 Tax=Kalanchoe fedtschenkoi TaxID=63787 RepID=A0A7N0VGT7_KALFE